MYLHAYNVQHRAKTALNNQNTTINVKSENKVRTEV